MRAAQFQLQGISSPLSLEHLTTLTLASNEQAEQDLWVSQLLPFLKLRSLRKLVAIGWWLWGPLVETNVRLGIVDMELVDFHMDRHDLIYPFFSCFPALEKLRYERFGQERRPVWMTSVADAITRASPRLKEVHITDSNSHEIPLHLADPATPVSFSQSKSLAILDSHAFYHWLDFCSHPVELVALLPSSLTHLTLRSSSDKTIEHVLRLLEMRESVPHLKVITIVLGMWLYKSKTDKNLLLLQQKGLRYGVEIIIEGTVYPGQILAITGADVEYNP